ncbi:MULTISPECIES: DUF4845 domain-containing protein [Methylovorus]|jgi:hypothetical protein|uniref:Putative transmembrane protein n=1 Tax=Methylovorus glucosotrophus (strain SIP3-4) TaxID=582744 RepID=C6X6N3_METGS|nr:MULTISPECIES: DUF4845 domain-containing protein [Methylovorus]ACT51026.1 putative transmembrane protein [Methylovorus glucosotrophus SIP3-4]ADQ84937.1 putative transmembrane protein [Methylovorus sp. MP688]KAF0843663.1 uncharacterized protein DUF4845 [Methylovorus glucosotrophus]
MNRQRGITFIGLVLLIAAGLFVVMVGMKLTPAYVEYFTIKKTLKKISQEPGFESMSRKEIMDVYTKAAMIDEIGDVNAKDLVVGKNAAGQNTVSIDYQKVIPIIANVSVLIDFTASTDASASP